MKKITTVILATTMILGWMPGQQVEAKIHHDEMRAVWIASVSNIDFPKTSGPEAQMAEFENYLDELVATGINTVIVQVRPKADALYDSDINPWSDVLTGVQGQYPGYDPLEFMIEAAHERDLSFHAWLNPYRVTQPGIGLIDLVHTHPARMNPDWTMTYNNAVYYNPEVEEVKVHVANTVQEIIENYDVDGIHFDDYFYPYNYPLPEGETLDGVVGDQRRDHVTDMVKRVNDVVQETDNEVVFGISPFGIWKNNHFDPDGSKTNGAESYYNVFADTKKWVEYEYIDYVVPQIYWEIGHNAADYETLVAWWNDLVVGTDVDLYIGQGIYKDQIASEITEQLEINENYSSVDGSVYFSMKDLLSNKQGVKTQVQLYYTGEGILPPTQQPPTEQNPPTEQEPEIESEDTMQTEIRIGTGVSKGSDLNIRKGPSTHYASVGKIQRQEIVDIYGEKDGWYYVRTQQGIEGFVSSEYIDVTSRDSKNIELIVNGNYVKPTVAPKLSNGTTLVPLRIISEELGAEVSWDNATKTVTIKDNGTEIILAIGSKTIKVNGQTGTISLAPEIINSTTMVPIRFISETLGARVDWNGLLQLITIEM